MAHDVFISHSSKDKTTGDAVCATLEANGIRCWIAPRDVLPGSDWGESIIGAIKGARVMVLVFSSNANQSLQIKREVERAVSHGLIIIPLRIEDVAPSPSLEYFMSTPHWLDAFTPPLEKHLQNLTQVIKDILRQVPEETKSGEPMPATEVVAQEGRGQEKVTEKIGRKVLAFALSAVVAIGLASWWVVSKAHKSTAHESVAVTSSVATVQTSFANASTAEPQTATPQSLTPEQVEELNIEQQGSLAGTGAKLAQTNGQIVIVGVFQNSPAEKAGLKAGQVITMINGIPTASMALRDAVKLIRGPKGSKVELIVGDPATAKTQQVVIVRDNVSLPPDVTGRVMDGSVGLLTVTGFSQRTSDMVSGLLRSFTTNGVRGIVMDLRGNGGGSLSAMIEVAGLFIGKNPTLFIKRDATSKQVQEIHATGSALWHGPMVVLVDGMTANAGELIASAFQTSERAKLVGQKTYGLGTSYNLAPQPDGSSKRVIAAFFLTARGEPINGKGDTPDVVLEPKLPKEDALRKAVEVLFSGKDVNPPGGVTAAVSEPAKQARYPVSAKGLVLHYDFAQEEPGGKITDMSEIGNHGRVTGAQWISTKGNGGAYEFAGGGDVIRPPNNDWLNCERITVSAWIKTSCLDNKGWRRVFLKSWDKGYTLCIIGDWREFKSRGFIRFAVGGMELGHFTDTDMSIADGQWHHIAATYDGEIQWLYVDGKPQSGLNEWKGKVLSTKVGLTIGNCMAPNSGEVFRGAIGELMIYNRPLSAEEISLLYSSQKVKYPADSASEPMSTVTPQSASPTPTPAVVAPPPGQSWMNSLGMKFVPVPGIAALFSIWDTRVQDYETFVTASGRAWQKPNFEQGPTHPAVMVSWDDAKAFCAWLTGKERRAGTLNATQEYRLPTDLEWSAAVGLENETGNTPNERSVKTGDVFPWGTQWPPPHGAGNYGSKLNVDDFACTSPVSSFSVNRFGLYDMGGNVWQWCEELLYGKGGAGTFRGGSWSEEKRFRLLSALRWGGGRGNRRDDIGFRCVLAGGGVSVSR